MPNDNFNLMSSNTNKGSNASSNNELTTAKLAILGGLLSTLGDAISTYAAVLALEELQKTKSESNKNDDKISELEKQVKYLTEEINQQKR
ncbi:hypothetical protein ACFOGI_02820 [Virgibacillus xinjiangensis]|uniref:Translation initiation factor 2 n=1 Tax=Virgibacillus xinjiangensis TaxID=393090 RepID=A0ABV7CS12_9BACI